MRKKLSGIPSRKSQNKPPAKKGDNKKHDEHKPITTVTVDTKSDKSADLFWLENESKPTRTHSAASTEPRPPDDDDWERPRSEVTRGSDTVIPVSSTNLAATDGPETNPDELWKGIKGSKSKVRRDYSGVPLLPVVLPEKSVSRTGSSRGPSPSTPASRDKESVNGKSDGNHSDGDSAGTNSPVSRASSTSNGSTTCGPTPTPGPSSRRSFYLSARPGSQFSDSSGGSQRQLVSRSTLSDRSNVSVADEVGSRRSFYLSARPMSQLSESSGGSRSALSDRSNVSVADEVGTPTFALSPEISRQSRRRFKDWRLESIVSRK